MSSHGRFPLKFEKYFAGSDVLPYLRAWEIPQVTLSRMTRWNRAREFYTPKQSQIGSLLLKAFAAGERFHTHVFRHLEKLLLMKTGIVKKNDAPLREQTVTEHTHALALLAMVLVDKINRETPFHLEKDLIVGCALLHDIPEGILKVDVPAIYKTKSDDLAEYRAFWDYISGMSEDSKQSMLCTYLLQFAYENPENFPIEAKVIMVDISNNHFNSAVFFHFLEHYDYLKFALAHYMNTGDHRLLLEVLDGTSERPGGVFQKFDKMTDDFPGLRVIWSEGFRTRCENFIKGARALES